MHLIRLCANSYIDYLPIQKYFSYFECCSMDGLRLYKPDMYLICISIESILKFNFINLDKQIILNQLSNEFGEISYSGFRPKIDFSKKFQEKIKKSSKTP